MRLLFHTQTPAISKTNPYRIPYRIFRYVVLKYFNFHAIPWSRCMTHEVSTTKGHLWFLAMPLCYVNDGNWTFINKYFPIDILPTALLNVEGVHMILSSKCMQVEGRLPSAFTDVFHKSNFYDYVRSEISIYVFIGIFFRRSVYGRRVFPFF